MGWGTITIKHVSADVKAQTFWLTNRKRGPDGWSNNPEAQGSADDDNTGVVMLPEINEDKRLRANGLTLIFYAAITVMAQHLRKL